MDEVMNPEFFFYDNLRWNFGFDNPNKAAVVFASLVPLVFVALLVFLLQRRRGVRWIGSAVCGIFLTLCLLFLSLTYSRGGGVAVVAALAYTLFAMRRSALRAEIWRKVGRCWVAIGIGAVMLLGCLGIGARARDGLGGFDESVFNRVILWKSALQMFYDCPSGVGAGRSGEIFSQWYQPTGADEKYRTMVSSYLTFLCERGAFFFFVLCSVSGGLWAWTRPAGQSHGRMMLVVALRASILAFLIAGIFSTTMEEPLVWVVPMGGLLALVGLAVADRQILRTPLWRHPAFAALLCLTLFLGGGYFATRDPLRRHFEKTGDSAELSRLSFRGSPEDRGGVLVVFSDPAVLGENSGKLLRDLCVGARLEIVLEQSNLSKGPVVVAGDAVAHADELDGRELILIAPGILDRDAATRLAHRKAPTLLLLPQIDEDGRRVFWEGVVGGVKQGNIKVVEISGVGNRMDWGWNQVIEVIDEFRDENS